MGNFEKAQKVLKLAHTMDQDGFRLISWPPETGPVSPRYYA